MCPNACFWPLKGLFSLSGGINEATSSQREVSKISKISFYWHSLKRQERKDQQIFMSDQEQLTLIDVDFDAQHMFQPFYPDLLMLSVDDELVLADITTDLRNIQTGWTGVRELPRSEDEDENEIPTGPAISVAP